MIFFWLALVALIFGLLGFLLHAFYFGKQGLAARLSREVAEMKSALEFREQANADTQEEIAKTRLLVQALEQQLEQRKGQMNALQRMAERQQEEIRQLEKAAIDVTAKTAKTDDTRPSSSVPPIQEPVEIPVPDATVKKIPLWKDNLNNILSMLDKIEKEVK